MTGFVHNVLGGIGHWFDKEYHQALVTFEPIIEATAQSLKQNAKADLVPVVVALGQKVLGGEKFNDLKSAAEVMLEAAGVKLGEQVLGAFINAVQVKYGAPHA